MTYANPNIADWLDEMTDQITVTPFVRRDSYGAPIYGAPFPAYNARVDYQQNFVRTASGEEKVSRGYVIFDKQDAMDPNDKITLSDGTNPLILVLNLETDEVGPLYTKIMFA